MIINMVSAMSEASIMSQAYETLSKQLYWKTSNLFHYHCMASVGPFIITLVHRSKWDTHMANDWAGSISQRIGNKESNN